METELLYIEEHLSCQNYMTTIETGFKFIEFTEDTEFGEDNTNKNYLLFFLKGDITISYNQFRDKSFQTGDMVLIPRSSLFKGVAPKESKLLLMFFDIPENNCDKLLLQSLSNICENMEYLF